jgi:hypothetical protein
MNAEIDYLLSIVRSPETISAEGSEHFLLFDKIQAHIGGLKQLTFSPFKLRPGDFEILIGGNTNAINKEIYKPKEAILIADVDNPFALLIKGTEKGFENDYFSLFNPLEGKINMSFNDIEGTRQLINNSMPAGGENLQGLWNKVHAKSNGYLEISMRSETNFYIKSMVGSAFPQDSLRINIVNGEPGV